jgi:hypothetical protein
MMLERAKRTLRRRAVVTPPEPMARDPQQDELPPSVCRALEATQFHERPGADERNPRMVISVPGKPPFMDGEGSIAEQLQARFPAEIKTPTQAETAARFLKQALRERRRMQRRAQGSNWASNW